MSAYIHENNKQVPPYLTAIPDLAAVYTQIFYNSDFMVDNHVFSTNTASSLFPFRQGTCYPFKRITMLGAPN
jgi:hypothetical protein